MSDIANINLDNVNRNLKEYGFSADNIVRKPLTLKGYFSKGYGEGPEFAFVHSCYSEMEIDDQRELWTSCSAQYVRILFSHLNNAYSKRNLVIPAYKKFKVATLGNKIFAIRIK